MITNYTEHLKSYWKSKDLTFIATFKRINKNAGFFNHFTNPVSKMKLYYPDFDGVEVLNKRVSFYYGNNSTLLDGAYYKVELEHTDNEHWQSNCSLLLYPGTGPAELFYKPFKHPGHLCGILKINVLDGEGKLDRQIGANILAALGKANFIMQ
jgi:hypothetical protein